MTRLAIVGSSHTGTVRQCDERSRAAHPGLEIDYFGLPGAPFRKAALDSDGVFRARMATAGEADLVRRINGATEIDLRPHERIWVIGHRYGLGRILGLLRHYDILEMPRTGCKDTMSEAFFWAALQGEIEASCDRILAQFGPDPRLSFSPAPYPAQKARVAGKYHEPGLAHILAHPERDRIFDRYQDSIRAALAHRGYGFVPQPVETLAAPFATRTSFLRGARDFLDLSVQTDDLRHMNAEYGFALFTSYAELHLGAA